MTTPGIGTPRYTKEDVYHNFDVNLRPRSFQMGETSEWRQPGQ